ncbi:MAG: PQQ-binding-like beta-propeller repeat protein [Gammaproteobacteria bacterium]|nr:PQQ-binding-like beta-propeller repeat protein [Gammaproteobacteria bacterium]MDE0247938.1 PQQ-binding-like beta-propeller repeat protein [Gammaproteobacteria bacterium]
MKASPSASLHPRVPRPATTGVLIGALVLLAAGPGGGRAQEPDASTQRGEWHYLGGDAYHQRYSALDQIDAGNFGELEVAWIWRGANFDPSPARGKPLYVDGVLYTVVGNRRTVAAIDGGTGETLWTYREPHTTRWERSTRRGHGKGVAYAEVDGRGVIFVATPAFFLHALDAETGRHIEGWGSAVPLPGFPETGVVDLLADILDEWGPWEDYVARGGSYDPDFGAPAELGHITSSAPPIVVNGVVVIGNSAESGNEQLRMENIPGDILAYDVRDGEQRWKFHVIPRPGEFGHDTWENDAWQWTGDVSSWAPISADPELGMVYIGTNPPTMDFYGGFRPGDGLFGNSIIALDVETGERVWHFQMVRHDIWDYDTSVAPLLINLTVDGEEIPALVANGKHGLTFVFDRATGEPVWPIELRPVPASRVPGEQVSPVQPFPTRPEPVGFLGLPEEELIDYTPELRREALEILEDFDWGQEPYTPYIHEGNELGKIATINCPSGSPNTGAEPSADPETGLVYISVTRNCRCPQLAPGTVIDAPGNPVFTGTNTNPDFITGETTTEWAPGQANMGCRGPRGLPLWRPPYSRIVAIDMNTGEEAWWVPNGNTPERIRDHPALSGLDLPNTGAGSLAPTLVTGTLLLHTGEPYLYALDKGTGERLGRIDLPAPGSYGLITYMHGGRQHVVVQVNSAELPNSLVALTLP